MEYKISIVSDKSEIQRCPVFHVDQYNWGGDYRPKTWGSLVFIPDTGFYVKMTCEEKNPIRVYTQPNDPVCKDSTMEAFFQFFPEEYPESYLNFEANANGALHAKYGNGRKDRTKFPLDLNRSCQCKGTIYEDCWTLELTIPLELIRFVYGKSDFQAGDRIKCNFFKIKEDHELEHFGSYTVIDNPVPNFHLTPFFAAGILVP